MLNDNEIASGLIMLNLALCNKFGSKFFIERPHDVKLIKTQALQLKHKGESVQASHMAYMIFKLKPFAQENLRTAVLALIYFTKGKYDIQEISKLLISGADVSEIACLVAR